MSARRGSRGGSRSGTARESELELRSGPLEDELRALAAEGVQSLLLEGGPTLATAFFRAGSSTSCSFSSRPCSPATGPRFLGDLADAGRALARHLAADRRRRAARVVRPRAVAFSHVHRHRPRARHASSPSTAPGSSSRRRQTTAELGDSIAIDGVCLTVVEHDGARFAFDVVAETLGRTTLGALAAGDRRQCRAGAPRGRAARRPHGAGPRRRRRPRPQHRPEGRLASGSTRRPRCSATASRRARSRSTASRSRRRARRRRLRGRARCRTRSPRRRSGRWSRGDAVNLEVDVLAKYVERLARTMGVR